MTIIIICRMRGVYRQPNIVNMKRVMLLCVAIAYFTSSFAQVWDYSKPDKRLTFGVRAGVNFNRLILGYDLPSDAVKSLTGFYAGANLDYNINNSFALESGLFFTDKGGKPIFYGKWQHYRHSYFLQIPVLVRIKIFLTNDINVQMRAGGFGAFRVGGNTFLDVQDYYNRANFRNFDAGIIGGLGLGLYKFYLGVQYERGLTKATNNAKTSNVAITLGYDF